MPNRQPRRSHAQWQSLIDKYTTQTELSQKQFCNAEQLSLATFRKWLYKLGANNGAKPKQHLSDPPPRPAGVSGFDSISIRASTHLPSGCCLELPGNIRLHTQSVPSVDYLRDLVKAFGHGH